MTKPTFQFGAEVALRNLTALMPPGSLQARFAGGAIWTTAGCAFSQAMSVVSGIVLARLLGLHGFGEFAIVQATVLSLTTFGDLGLGLSTTKHIAAARKATPGWIPQIIRVSSGVVVCAGLLLSCVLVAASGRMANRLLGDSAHGAAFAIAAALLVLELLNRLQLGCLSGLQAFRRSAQVQIVRGFALVVLPAAFALRFGLMGALGGLALVSLCTCALSHAYLVKECEPLRGGPRESTGGALRSLLGMAGAVWISGVMLAGSTYAAKIALAGAHGGMNEMGLLNAAEKWRVAVEFLASMLSQVSIPIMAGAFSEGMRDRLRKLLIGTHVAALATASAAALVITMGSGIIMRAYGPDFARGREVLVICAVAAVITAAYSVGSAALWAFGRIRLMLILDAVKAAAIVCCVFAGLVNSANSYAWVSLVSVLLGLAGMALALRSELRAMRSPAPSAYVIT